MALAIRKIKRQIRSIKNTQKITKAMELVSAAKMRKAVASVTATRPYDNLAWQVVLDLAKRTNPEWHALLADNKGATKVGILLLSSNRGLCGVFNQQVIKKSLNYIKEEAGVGSEDIELITWGQKGALALSKSGFKVTADFPKPEIVLDVKEIKAVSKILIQGYLDKKYRKVILIFTDFISPFKQKPIIKQLLPLQLSPDVGAREFKRPSKSERDTVWNYEYLFEPNPAFILQNFLPRLIEMQIFQAVLESNASEHSARMLAMRNASDSASNFLSDLTMGLNKARQAGITQEIAEISASKAAIE